MTGHADYFRCKGVLQCFENVFFNQMIHPAYFGNAFSNQMISAAF